MTESQHPAIAPVTINGGVTHLGRDTRSTHTLCGVPIIPATRWLPHTEAMKATTRLCAMCVGRFHRLQGVDGPSSRFGGS